MLSPEKSMSPRRKLSWLSVWPGVSQTSSVSPPTVDLVAVFDRAVDLDRRQRHVDLLGFDLGKGAELVARFQRRRPPADG